MESYIVETRALKKYYQLGTNVVKALDGVDFRVKDQEFVSIIGKSGSGKSTLLHMIGGLDVPTEGEVYIDGKNLAKMNREQLAVFRRRKKRRCLIPCPEDSSRGRPLPEPLHRNLR